MVNNTRKEYILLFCHIVFDINMNLEDVGMAYQKCIDKQGRDGKYTKPYPYMFYATVAL